jgi:asparagine synthase (glutamine-hydrolysing)
MGIQSLFYAQAGGALVFATSLDGVCAHPSVQRSLSPQGVFDYLYYHVCPGPGTIVQDVARLMPGHLVEFSADGGLRERAYWALQFDEQDAVPLQDRIHEFKSLVAASVSEAAQGARVGACRAAPTVPRSTACFAK